MAGPGAIRMASMVVTGFVAVTAVAGGIALAIGAEDSRFPRAWLDGTPFDSYVIPGLILAIAVGGSASVALAALWMRLPLAGAATVVAALALAGQILCEILLLKQPGQPTPTEWFYLGVAALMATCGTLAHLRL